MNLFSAVSAGSLLVVGMTVLSADAPSGGDNDATSPDPETTIGVVDVARVINSYPPLVEQKANLAADVKKAEEELKKKQQELAAMQQQLRLVPAGSPEHTELIQRITTLQADAAASLQTQKGAFIRREAEMYDAAYKKALAAIEEIVSSRDVEVVLNVKGAAPDPAQPQAVIARINRQVVWHKGQCDLTDAVIEQMAAEPAEEVTEPDEEVEEPPLLPAAS